MVVFNVILNDSGKHVWIYRIKCIILGNNNIFRPIDFTKLLINSISNSFWLGSF